MFWNCTCNPHGPVFITYISASHLYDSCSIIFFQKKTQVRASSHPYSNKKNVTTHFPFYRTSSLNIYLKQYAVSQLLIGFLLGTIDFRINAPSAFPLEASIYQHPLCLRRSRTCPSQRAVSVFCVIHLSQSPPTGVLLLDTSSPHLCHSDMPSLFSKHALWNTPVATLYLGFRYVYCLYQNIEMFS